MFKIEIGCDVTGRNIKIEPPSAEDTHFIMSINTCPDTSTDVFTVKPGITLSSNLQLMMQKYTLETTECFSSHDDEETGCSIIHSAEKLSNLSYSEGVLRGLESPGI